MGVINDAVKRIVETLYIIDPQLKDYPDKVNNIVTTLIKGQMADPTIVMDNNVVGVSRNITLTELCSYLDTEKPVVSGNATFYAQPTELRSPTSNMLLALKKKRKSQAARAFSWLRKMENRRSVL